MRNELKITPESELNVQAIESSSEFDHWESGYRPDENALSLLKTYSQDWYWIDIHGKRQFINITWTLET